MSIYIGEPVEVNDMQGPCTDGFHVPTKDELTSVNNILKRWNTYSWNYWRVYLHMPYAGYMSNTSGGSVGGGSAAYYWSSTWSGDRPVSLYMKSNKLNIQADYYTTNGMSIRPFKDEPVAADSNWTLEFQGTWGGGIYHNSTLGLISISWDGSTWITIADKNLGATVVYNDGDTLSAENCGKYYQRGNNYGFPKSGATTTSTTLVNASSYGPGNYYNSDTFIKSGVSNWDTSNNSNLRGGTSQGTSTKSVEVQNIYIGEKTVYEGEYIEYKMNADSNGILCVPLSGLNTSGSRSCPYNWKVSVDGGSETIYNGTGGSGGYITLSGYTSGSNHTIMIKPVTEDYQRARAYNWYNVSLAGNITEIVYDSSYMGYGVSATDTGDYFRAYQYDECPALTNTENEYLPDTVVTIGNYFRSGQYSRCTSLKYAGEESLPNSVTSIGSGFRYWQYAYCSALTEIKGWKDLSIGNSSYRENQYDGCTANKTVKVISDVGYNSDDQNTLQNDYVTSVSVPSAYLNNFKNSSNYPWVGITDSKFIGY